MAILNNAMEATTKRRWRLSSRRAPLHPFAPFLIPVLRLDEFTPWQVENRWEELLNQRYSEYFGASDVLWSADNLHPLDGLLMNHFQGETEDEADMLQFQTSAWRHDALRAMFRPSPAVPDCPYRVADVPQRSPEELEARCTELFGRQLELI